MADPTIPQSRDEAGGATPDAVESQPPVGAVAAPAAPEPAEATETLAAEAAATEPPETVETAAEEEPAEGSADVNEAPAPVTGEATAATEEETTATATTPVAPLDDEPIADAPLADEPVADALEDEPVADPPLEVEPVSDLTVAEPVASAAPQPPRGIWTDEQAEALRNRVRDVTAKAVDRAAGAVIETVNNVAAAIRARTSDRRGDGTRR